MKLIAYLILALTGLDQLVSSDQINNCFFETRTSNIDPSLGTRLSCSSFDISESGEFKSVNTWFDLDSKLGFIKDTIALKQKNPKLKVVAVVDAWNEGSAKYWAMVADPAKRATFVSSTLLFFRQYGFDGLDLKLEYPGQSGGSNTDRENFITFLQEIKEAFDPYGLELNVAWASSKSSTSIDSKTLSYRTCIDNELYKHESDCSKFYQCAHGQLIEMSCPSGLYFNDKIKQCDWPYNVPC